MGTPADGQLQAGQVQATSQKAFSYTLDQILLRVSEACNPRQRSEDTPTASAWASTRHILIDANKIAPIDLDATVVEASDGDLLIHWDTPARSIVLICSRDEHAPSIYRETLEGARPTSSQLSNDASASSLSEALAWVQSPNR